MTTPDRRSHNIPMLLRTAEALEQGLPDLEFDMSRIEGKSSCGSVSCIIGHVLAVKDGQFVAEDPLSGSYGALRVLTLARKAGEALGLSAVEGHELFFPNKTLDGPFNPDEGRNLHNVHPSSAAAVLRHLATTGEIDWWKAFPGADAPAGSKSQ